MLIVSFGFILHHFILIQAPLKGFSVRNFSGTRNAEQGYFYLVYKKKNGNPVLTIHQPNIYRKQELAIAFVPRKQKSLKSCFCSLYRR